MSEQRFTKMLGFELRAMIFGSDINSDVPFVDLRRKDGIYTANAVLGSYEYELYIGKRWLRRNIPNYIADSLHGLAATIDRSKEDHGYKESIRRITPW